MMLRKTEDLEGGKEQRPTLHRREKEFLRSGKWMFSRRREPMFRNSRK
jgi:hypothetical protein